tara:strand:+ start:26259 stop:26873 length:615 start_codon:yes stop_codon:yes gene_type:complete
MKIICIGRNYVDHAKELNNPIPSQPLIFCKPDSAIHQKKNPFYIPSFTNDLHYETEIVVKISRLGKGINQKFAHKYYNQIGLGIDFTARDIQQECKEKGWPWERAKSFDSSAVMGSEFINKSTFESAENIPFKMFLNGEIAQDGNTKDMIFSIDKLIVEISKIFTLKIGDLIFTGTPAGVGPVKPGDLLEGYLGDKKLIDLRIR